MKIKFGKIIGVFCLSLLITSRVNGQTLLTQAFLSGGGGINVLTNSLTLWIGGGTLPRSHDPFLFQNVLVQTEDVDQVYIAGPTDDPAGFDLTTHYITDGIVEYLGYSAGGGHFGIPEARFFSSLPAGNNGIDLAGFNIDYYSLVFTSLAFESPGSNPSHDGQWTDYSYSAVFSVYGEPVPEPTSLVLLGLGVVVLSAKVPWLKH